MADLQSREPSRFERPDRAAAEPSEAGTKFMKYAVDFIVTFHRRVATSRHALGKCQDSKRARGISQTPKFKEPLRT
jgi:hypothetical protein